MVAVHPVYPAHLISICTAIMQTVCFVMIAPDLSRLAISYVDTVEECRAEVELFPFPYSSRFQAMYIFDVFPHVCCNVITTIKKKWKLAITVFLV